MLRLQLTTLLLLCLGVATAQSQTAPASAGPALGARDYLEIEQLVYKYGWALDSGENNGFAYADLYTADGTFTGTNQGPGGRTYQGRENLAALARGARLGPLNVRHAVTNLIVTPTADGAVGRVYVGIFDPGEPGTAPRAGHGGFYDDVYAKTAEGWRFKKRTFYEGKWGEPNVPVPPPVQGVHALREGAPGPTSKARMLSEQDHVAIQQLVARMPYEIDMNADSGAAYANAFTPDGTFACVLPDTGGVAVPGLPAGCAPHTGKFTTKVRPHAKGRDALARMVTEEPHGPAYVRHFIFNHVIERSGRGATGKAYVVVADITPRQKPGFAHSIFMIGRYDDEYVKTAQGWRIKSRVFTAVAGGMPATASR
ncbi:MAG TPA: nuclear transport factor 2 family protein [Gammaproteobacteria bacterium]|nr:nuclear transport factor 2 family protein [Gammaproteobacteria bacterium]